MWSGWALFSVQYLRPFIFTTYHSLPLFFLKEEKYRYSKISCTKDYLPFSSHFGKTFHVIRRLKSTFERKKYPGTRPDIESAWYKLYFTLCFNRSYKMEYSMLFKEYASYSEIFVFKVSWGCLP